MVLTSEIYNTLREKHRRNKTINVIHDMVWKKDRDKREIKDINGVFSITDFHILLLKKIYIRDWKHYLGVWCCKSNALTTRAIPRKCSSRDHQNEPLTSPVIEEIFQL